MTGCSPRFILIPNQPLNFPFSPLFLQYLEIVVACQHDTIPHQQHHWIPNWGFILCNDSLIPEQKFPFHTLFTDMTPQL